MPRVVFAFDKFRGTADAAELVACGQHEAAAHGWRSSGAPLGDGGEGSLDVVGGANQFTTVTNPLGDPVEAGWRLAAKVAFIEMAAASGLAIVGGAEGNDPLAADTYGTGELIAHAVDLGAKTIHVMLGGSATTDGGFGAIRAMPHRDRLRGVDLVVAADVKTRFTEAAVVFGQQKGASPAEIELLTRRLERLVQVYRDEYRVDVSKLAGAGAAGGLAGGLLAMGARIESGFDVLADLARLDELIEGADLVVTGEGRLDDESFNGKVVGGVAEWANDAGVPVVAIVGSIDKGLEIPDRAELAGLEVISLTERFGLDAAMTRTVESVQSVIAERLSGQTVR